MRLNYSLLGVLYWRCLTLYLLQIFKLTLLKEVPNIAQVLSYSTITELVDFIYNAVKELSVVRYENYRTIKLADSLLKNIL